MDHLNSSSSDRFETFNYCNTVKPALFYIPSPAYCLQVSGLPYRQLLLPMRGQNLHVVAAGTVKYEPVRSTEYVGRLCSVAKFAVARLEEPPKVSHQCGEGRKPGPIPRITASKCSPVVRNRASKGAARHRRDLVAAPCSYQCRH